MELPAHLSPYRHIISGKCKDETCSRILFPRVEWKRLSREVRMRLINNNCRRSEARGLCEQHFIEHRAAGTLDQFGRSMVASTQGFLSRYHEMIEYADPNDVVDTLAQAYGIDRESARVRLKNNGVTPPKRGSVDTSHRDEVLEEVVHLYRSSQGVAAIAEAVGMTADELVAASQRWRQRDLIDFDLAPQWSAVA